MAMPKSQEVIGFLVDQLSSKKQYTKAFFVGLRKIDEEWEWIDDTPLSEGLSDQIENNFHSCAVIQEGSLRKMPCDFKAGYICEMKTGKLYIYILLVYLFKIRMGTVFEHLDAPYSDRYMQFYSVFCMYYSVFLRNKYWQNNIFEFSPYNLLLVLLTQA